MFVWPPLTTDFSLDNSALSTSTLATGVGHINQTFIRHPTSVLHNQGKALFRVHLWAKALCCQPLRLWSQRLQSASPALSLTWDVSMSAFSTHVSAFSQLCRFPYVVSPWSFSSLLFTSPTVSLLNNFH